MTLTKSILAIGWILGFVAGCGNDGEGSGDTANSSVTTGPTDKAPSAGPTDTTIPSVTTPVQPSDTSTGPAQVSPIVQPTESTSTPTPDATVTTPTSTGPEPTLGAGGGTGPGPTGTAEGGAGGDSTVVGAGGAGGGGGGSLGMGGAPSQVDLGKEYFSEWPQGAEPDAIGLKLARLFNSQTSDGTRHYKEACAWYGALQIAVLLADGELLQSLTGRYDRYKGGYADLFATEGHVDENVWGIVPLELSLHNEDSVYLEDGTAIADHQLDNLGTQARDAIDDMFMITGLQVQAYRASGDKKYLDAAAETMEGYLNRLQQDDGLFFQLKPTDSVRWGRGNGWFASGMTEMLRELDPGHSSYARIREGYDRMMEALLNYQIGSGTGAGLWRQVLDYDGSENYAETSGSAMFTNAMVTGVKNGWLDEASYGAAARAAWIALVGYLESDGRLKGVSDWMYGGTTQEYTSRGTVTGDNHGQAPMLWSAAALIRGTELDKSQ